MRAGTSARIERRTRGFGSAGHLKQVPFGDPLTGRSGAMTVKCSEDVVPLSDLKVNPGRILKRADQAHRAVLLTSRGRGVAVVQSLPDYERGEEERAFTRAVWLLSSHSGTAQASQVMDLQGPIRRGCEWGVRMVGC